MGNKIKTFEEYWESIVPEADPDNETLQQVIAIQKSAAQSGWNGAMQQVRFFIEQTKV